MPAENALAFIRSNAAARALPPVIVIAGPHAFLREYVLDSIARRLAGDGFQYRSFQIGSGDDYGELINEMRGQDLFAPKLLIACRVLRSRREKADDDDAPADAGESRRGSGADESALADLIADARGPSYLALLYERDNAAAKIRRAAEKDGLLINCMRPFDNQLDQYVQAFARSAGLRLAPDAVDLLIARHAADLAAIANSIGKAAIFAPEGKAIQASDLDEQGARRVPEAFELAESISRGRTAMALAQLERSLALGRDAFELLAVELIPLVRRMMIAATMTRARRSTGEIASALGLPPQSGLAMRAIDGARRLGLKAIERAYWRACRIDADFKNGELKERGEALTGLVLELMTAGNE
jgi:DNA polymerase III delta subunit